MKNNVLTNLDEPTDVERMELKHEVAQEAKSKALIAKSIWEKFNQVIKNAQSSYNCSRK